MMSSGPDALKKTVKDLHRSSVSLPRFQLLLEEVKIILTKMHFYLLMDNNHACLK